MHVYGIMPWLPEAAEALRPDPGLPAVTVRVLRFDELDATTAYDVWRLRQQVFVVEQHSPYPDLDGRDQEPGTLHLLAEQYGAVVGYARVLDDGDRARIGRVVVARQFRGQGSPTSWCARRWRPSVIARCGWTPRPDCWSGTRRTASSPPDRRSTRTACSMPMARAMPPE